MSIERVLQVPVSGKIDVFVVVHASGEDSPSTTITLLATEDTHPYTANGQNITSFQINFYGADNERKFNQSNSGHCGQKATKAKTTNGKQYFYGPF